MTNEEQMEQLKQFLKQAEIHEEQCRINYRMAQANTCVLIAEIDGFLRKKE